jgi:hypothetical protein
MKYCETLDVAQERIAALEEKLAAEKVAWEAEKKVADLMTARNLDLALEIADARKDSVRLEWCFEHNCCSHLTWRETWVVVNSHRVHMTDEYDTPRAAIDAAMQKGGPA